MTAVPAVPEEKVVWLIPFVVVSVKGLTLPGPLTTVKDTGMPFRTNTPPVEVSEPAELNVRFATMADVCAVVMLVGDTVIPRTSHGW